MTDYKLVWGGWTLSWGERLAVKAECEILSAHAADDSSQLSRQSPWEWSLTPGIQTARTIVRDIGVLLAAVRVRLGAADHLEILLHNVEASLALSGREAALPLSSIKASGDDARSELAVQAQQIGAAMTTWLREDAVNDVAISRYGLAALGQLEIRSRCEQHLWTPEAARLIMGPTGSPLVMQLYNEFLHQVILLRDALLPFANWQEIPFLMDNAEEVRVRGMRWLEQGRQQFLVRLLTGQVPHRAIVRFAQEVLNTTLGSVGYGFQYRLGTVLPAALGIPISAAASPRILLRWHPVLTVKTAAGAEPEEAVFEYELDDYYSAASMLATTLSSSALEPQLLAANEARLVTVERESSGMIQAMEPSTERVIQLRLRMIADGEIREVDLGQAARGHRYLYRIQEPAAHSELPIVSDDGEEAAEQSVHADWLLTLPGLQSAEEGIYTIRTAGNPLVQWMLLGKLYPENVIAAGEMKLKISYAAARGLGKQFGAKFIIEG
ncbi:hypothetical protein EBB07_23160 [Paenibacillaceae bacterium]|nr:hypothetical protein EBB07_23160 [Paenibacillaceae bacterium]